MCGSKNCARLCGTLALGIFLLVMHREAPAQFKILSDGFSATGGIAPSSSLILIAAGGQTQAVGTGANQDLALTTGFISTVAPGFSIPNNSRAVRVVNVSASPGSAVSVPITLESQGDENALGFSLSFDPAILSNPQATLGRDASSLMLVTNTSQVKTGKLGLALAANPGKVFAAGTRQILVVSFMVDANTLADSAGIGFSDVPITREVSDSTATALTADYLAGRVLITRGLEADVTPRPNGNGSVTISDWVQVGRFVASLDTLRTNVNEFQRADCAPRACGNGRLSIADWVQAGRYAASLDTLVPACGPTKPTSAMNAVSKTDGARTVRVPDIKLTAGQTKLLLPVELDAQGDENALGFSLNFDPVLLKFDTVAVGNGASGTTLLPSLAQKNNGRIGIALALPAGAKFAAGVRQVVVVTFTVAPNSLSRTTATFGDQPVAREVVDVNANSLSVIWLSGIMTSVQDGKSAEEIPQVFALNQNYPNPFNPETSIQYAIPGSIASPVRVTLRIYNVTGQVVRTLVDEQKTPGYHRAVWDGRNDLGVKISSGVYLYTITAGEFKATKRMTMLK